MEKLCFILFILLSCLACNKENNAASLQGEYVEKSPVTGRSKMIFEEGDTVIIIKDITSGFTPDTNTFRYQITNGQILLTLIPDDNNPATGIDFTLLTDTSFKTGDLYIHIPEAPPVTLTFTK